MNIFVLDPAPVIAAQMHADRHVTKMSVEYAQLLSTAHHIHASPVAPQVYRPTHVHHPCTQWVAAHPAHYEWVYALACATWDEYTRRYARVHASDARLRDLLRHEPPAVRGIRYPPTFPPLCMPAQYQRPVRMWEDVVASYRAYYIGEKSAFATWKTGNIPDWYTSNTQK